MLILLAPVCVFLRYSEIPISSSEWCRYLQICWFLRKISYLSSTFSYYIVCVSYNFSERGNSTTKCFSLTNNLLNIQLFNSLSALFWSSAKFYLKSWSSVYFFSSFYPPAGLSFTKQWMMIALFGSQLVCVSKIFFFFLLVCVDNL